MVTCSARLMHLGTRPSVVLRDPAVKTAARPRAEPTRRHRDGGLDVLSLNEGKTIDHCPRPRRQGVHRQGQGDPQRLCAQHRGRFAVRPAAATSSNRRWQLAGSGKAPIIEVDGKPRFSLPGEPIFRCWRTTPSSSRCSPGSCSRSARAGAQYRRAQLHHGWYEPGGVLQFDAPEKGDTLDIVGWVTMDNQSGKTFDEATIKLMAGDVSASCSWRIRSNSRAEMKSMVKVLITA